MEIPSFKENNQLLLGILYDSVVEYETFVHARSVFTDKWYNFIVPSVTPDTLNWLEVASVIEREQKNGFELSYYVPEHLYEAYLSFFTAQGKENVSESDFYIFGQNKEEAGVPGELILVDEVSIEEFLDMAEICFPEWDNNTRYGQFFYDLQKKDKPGYSIKNFLYKIESTTVGFCGYAASPELSLAYIHNTGVLPEFQRKGYFSNMVKQLGNLSLRNDIRDSFALVDGTGASFHALQKLGFSTKHKYFLFDL